MVRKMVEIEGRTVFISSHLLDEVEKMCDAAAIVDRGRVISQGPIAELATGGAHEELIVGVDDPDLAMLTLSGSGLVEDVQRSDEGLTVVLSGPARTAARVNAALVEAGVEVTRLEPVRQSLERRFLEITSRIDEPIHREEVPA